MREVGAGSSDLGLRQKKAPPDGSSTRAKVRPSIETTGAMGQEAGLKKKDRQNKALVDEISATIILQTYLESKRF